MLSSFIVRRVMGRGILLVEVFLDVADELDIFLSACSNKFSNSLNSSSSPKRLS